MTNNQWGIVMLMVLALLLWLFFLWYRKLEAGRPQMGIHIQVVAMLLAWLGGLVGFVLNQVEIGAKLVCLALVVGLCGHFIHTLQRRDK